MKVITKYSFFIICTVLLASCTLYKDFPIEIYKPGEVKLPGNVKQIALLYRNFKYPTDTLQNYFRHNNQLWKVKENRDANIDSIAVTSCLDAVYQKFTSEKISSRVVVFPYDLLPPQTNIKLSPLPVELVKKLVSSSQSDIIISLETFSNFYAEFSSESEQGEHHAVISAGIWAVYNSETGGLLEYKSIVDTVYWYPVDENSVKIKLPPRLAAIQIASSVFGENYAKRFTSNWETVNRVLIIPPVEEFRLAAQYVNDQEWAKASELWKRYSARNFGRLAVCARYNLAFAAEMNDNLDEALDWIKQALEQASVYNNKEELHLIVNYQILLLNRKNEFARINIKSNEEW